MSDICSDQDAYNHAFKKALNKYKKDEDVKYGLRCGENDIGCKVGMIVMFIIMILFYLWALILALKVSEPEHRILHVLFALATGPLYVLAYYASSLGGKDFNLSMDF